MKKKIISFVGLLLFVGVVVFNIQIVNSNEIIGRIKLDKIEAMASGSENCSGKCNNSSCSDNMNSMTVSGVYYCCATKNLWTGKTCSE